MELGDPESRGGQPRDLPADAVGPVLPHTPSMTPRAATGTPRFLGWTEDDARPSVGPMRQVVQHTAAGEGTELVAPDAVVTVKVDADHTAGQYEVFEVQAPRGPATPLHSTGWGKSYYVLHGRMLVQIEDEAYDLVPGSCVAIPPGAAHTFTVLTPSTTFLVVSLTGAMGRFHADLDATVPHGLPFDQVGRALTEVLGRHDVTVLGMEVAR